MSGFELTPEQAELQALAREFVSDHVKPVAFDRDKVRDWRERAPWEIVEAGSRRGLRTLALPPEWGGKGIDYATICTLAEELAVGDCGVAIIFSHCWRWSRAMPRIASRAQQERYIPRFIKDDRCLVGHPATEAERGGTDNVLRLSTEPMVTVARRNGDYYLVSGKKMFISNATMGQFFMMLVRTGQPEEYPGGISMLLVEREFPGFSNGTIPSKIGSRLLVNGEIILENCRVPIDNLIGEEGRGLEASEKGYGATAPEIAAILVGIARAAYEEALDFARTRIAGGTQIINHQAVQLRLADMYADLEAARSLVQRAAWSVDYGGRQNRALWYAARFNAGEAAARVTQSAMKLCGGRGIMEHLPFEKYVRDALAYQHMHGTNDALRLKTAEALAREGQARAREGQGWAPTPFA
jgi:alkylation response protein AidB-like acyl-CoA dehydrogenase